MAIVITTSMVCDMCDFELHGIVSSQAEIEDVQQMAEELGWDLAPLIFAQTAET